MTDIEKVIDFASKEVGYLEKKNKSQLDNKTANAGSNNYTKYWQDMSASLQGQPWCACFVCYCFKKVFGEQKGKELLCATKGGWSYYTPTAAQYFKNKNQWHTKNPQAGDVIFFKNSTRICHTGIVYKVDENKVYTIEGNTSGGSEVIANGGGVCKKQYPLNKSSIAGYGRPNYGTSSSATNSTASSSKNNNKKTVTASVLNIRASGNNTSKIVGTYKKGEVVTILKTVNGWCQTNKGWCSSAYLQ